MRDADRFNKIPPPGFHREASHAYALASFGVLTAVRDSYTVIPLPLGEGVSTLVETGLPRDFVTRGEDYCFVSGGFVDPAAPLLSFPL